MSYEILELKNGKGCLFCNTTDLFFGPMGSVEELKMFAAWLPDDPRSYTANTLKSLFDDFKINEVEHENS